MYAVTSGRVLFVLCPRAGMLIWIMVRMLHRALGLCASGFGIKREVLARHTWIPTVLAIGFFLSAAAALGNWYLWATGNEAVHVPLLWTLLAFVIIVLEPRRRVLIFAVLGLYVVYGLKVVLLNQEPRAWYLVGAAAALLVLLVVTAPRDWR